MDKSIDDSPIIYSRHRAASLVGHQSEQLPGLVAAAGSAARFAWEEFVYGKLRNPGTRRAYLFAVRRFLHWCADHEVALNRVTPAHIGRYMDEQAYAAATMKLHLSALRHFFDQLVMRHVILLNPAACVRGERLDAVEGKTPEITVKQARQLLASIDRSSGIGLRDHAVIAILVYTAVRVGAIAKLRHDDFYDSGEQHHLRFIEKGTKAREIPVRHDLRRFLLDYLAGARLESAEKGSPLFRTAVRRTGTLTTRGMTTRDISRMIKRRLAGAGLPAVFSPHSFRVCTLTDLLSQGVPLEDVQLLAGHKDPRTTRLYDRRHREVTRNIVERISV